jgi:hypothetical protein
MPRHRWSKRRVVSSGYVAIRPFCRFEAAGVSGDQKLQVNGQGKIVG